MTKHRYVTTDGHARGHRHLPPPPASETPKEPTSKRRHDQPWLPTNALTDRLRRSPRQ